MEELELRQDIAPEITVENNVGTLPLHPITGEERAQCRSTAYIFRYKGENIASITHWRFEDGLELERVSTHYTDGEYVRSVSNGVN